ncbi:hypothetical protein DL96DRAFT_1625193 [Flagelloscypha sp. PMI_526]|nr:hypothetical protein DL96DRAFT_1625193 [Flagelloscypha sp. PMI_526]
MQAARFPHAPRRLATAQQLELEDSTLEYDLSRFDSVPTPSTAVAEKIFNDPNAWFGSTLAKFGQSQERQNSLAASPEADKTTFVEVTPTSAISPAKPKSSSQSSTDSTESTDSTDSSVSIKPFTRKRTVLPESPTSSSSSSGRSSAAFWSSDGRSSGAESDITVDSDSAKLKPEALRASRLSISFFWSEKNLFRALPSPAAPSPLTPGAGFASLAKSTHLFVPGAPLPTQEMKQRRRSNSVDGFQFTVPPLKLAKRQNSNSVPSSPIVEVQVEVASPRNPDVQALKIQNSFSAPPSPISTNAPLLESMTSPPAANSAPSSPLPTDAPMSLFQGSPRMRPTGPRLGPRPLPTPSGHHKSASLVSSNPSLLLASPVQSSAPLSDEKSSLPLDDPPPYTDAPGASASQQIPLPPSTTTTTPSTPLRQARPNPSLVARPQSEFNSSEVESVPSIEEMRASVAALPMVPALRKRRSRAALSMAARPHSSVDPDAAGVQVSEGQGRLPLPGIPPSIPLPPLPPPIPQSGLPSRAMMRRPSVSRMQYKNEAQGQGQEQQPTVPIPLQNEPDLWPKPAPTLKSAMKKPSMDSATPPLPSMGFSRPQDQTLPRSESPAPIVAPTLSSSNPPIQMDLVNQKLEATGPTPSPASTLERGKSERGRRSPFPAAKRRGLPSRETSPSESVRSNSTTTTTTSSISEPVTRSVTPVQNGPFSSMGTQPVPTRSTTPVPLPHPVPSNPVQQQEIETPRPQPPSTVSTPTASRPPQQPTPVPTPAPPQKPISILRPTRSKSRIRFAEGVKTKTHGLKFRTEMKLKLEGREGGVRRLHCRWLVAMEVARVLGIDNLLKGCLVILEFIDVGLALVQQRRRPQRWRIRIPKYPRNNHRLRLRFHRFQHLNPLRFLHLQSQLNLGQSLHQLYQRNRQFLPHHPFPLLLQPPHPLHLHLRSLKLAEQSLFSEHLLHQWDRQSHRCPPPLRHRVPMLGSFQRIHSIEVPLPNLLILPTSVVHLHRPPLLDQESRLFFPDLHHLHLHCLLHLNLLLRPNLNQVDLQKDPHALFPMRGHCLHSRTHLLSSRHPYLHPIALHHRRPCGEHGRSASTGEALPTDVVRGLRSRANSVTGKRPAMPELVPF